ncbi:MAG TPA: iron transporter [Hyphomicrobiales bacterium]|nr:iron transporter [Hyphomicrobiales bacterium]
MPVWLALASRVLAATAGAYVCSVLGALALSRLLPLALGPATMAGMLASFWIFCLCALWAFAPQRPAMAWLGLVAFGALCGLGLGLGLG